MHSGTENQKNPSRNLSDIDHRYDDGSTDTVYNTLRVYKLLANNYTVETDRNLYGHLDVYGLY